MLPVAYMLLSAIVAAAPPPKSYLTVDACRVGDQAQFVLVSCDIPLHNSGDRPIRIKSAKAAHDWDSIGSQVVVPPHGAAYIKATINTRDSVGYSKHSFLLVTDEPGMNAVRGASVSAFVSTVLDQARPSIDFGAFKLGSALPTKEVTLSSREVGDFRILAIASKPDYLDVAIGTDGRTVSVALRANAPWGLLSDKVKLKINAPQQAEAWVTVSANVIGEIAPNSNPVAVGLMRTNVKNEFLVRLTSGSGKDFKIGNVKLEGIEGKAHVTSCVPKVNGCRTLRVVVDNKQPRGRLVGKLLVDLPDFERTLPIDVVGMLLAPDTKVHDLNAEMEKRAVGGATSEALGTGLTRSVDLQQALVRASSEDLVPPPGEGPLLRWSVANDATIHGYIIYRSDAEHGPFLRVNKDLVRAIEDASQTTASYQWRDTSAVSGQTYWYEIGTVNINGDKAALSGAQKVVAK